MSILKRLGLAPKQKQGAPNIGENKRKEQEETAYRKTLYYRLFIFLSFLALIIYLLPQTGFRYSVSYTVGEPWMDEDLTAPFTFALLKTPAELEEERSAVRENTPPIFHIDEETAREVAERVETLPDRMEPVLESYLDWRQALEQNGDEASTDSLRMIREQDQSELDLSESSWQLLFEEYETVIRQDRALSGFLGRRLADELNNLTSTLLGSGVIDRGKDELETRELTVRDLVQRTERNFNINHVRDEQEARQFARERLQQQFGESEAELAAELYDAVMEPNWIYSEEETQARLNEALSEISTTKGAVAQGQVIVRRGDIVTDETANMLRSLAEARADTATTLERWLRFSGEVILLLITTLFFLIYLYLYRKNIFENSAMFLLVFLVLSIVLVASGVAYNFDNISPYVVPIAVAPLILTIIFDSRVGLLATITLAVITAIYHNSNFEYLVATVMACSFGVFSVRDINKRTQFFVTTPLVVFLGYLLVVSGFALTRFGGFDSYLNQMTFIVINSIFILFTYPLILFFEKTFNVTTDFTYLELADTNLPLLKDLMNKAPGTFHHSLQVANLAESAAAAIGANALLCRTGALYHDIGKMNKPGYFIENQTGTNEHDKLKPRMSALVIKAHVNDGVKMAREHDLPEKIIEFIQTHHGSSLIRYFYDKAVKSDSSERGGEIRDDDFRYDGPTPSTRETGILLLADGVEAASRSMKEPTYNKLENLINRMFDDHVQDGQLDNCPLTFQDLNIIKKSFLNILIGVYHSRIEYPDDKERDSGEKNPDKEPKPPESGQTTEAGSTAEDPSKDETNSTARQTGDESDRAPGQSRDKPAEQTGGTGSNTGQTENDAAQTGNDSTDEGGEESAGKPDDEPPSRKRSS